MKNTMHSGLYCQVQSQETNISLFTSVQVSSQIECESMSYRQYSENITPAWLQYSLAKTASSSWNKTSIQPTNLCKFTTEGLRAGEK